MNLEVAGKLIFQKTKIRGDKWASRSIRALRRA